MATPLAFTAEQVARLAGLSKRQVQAWARSDFYPPHFGRHGLYSFRDLVALRTLAILRNEHQVSIHGARGLREFGKWLAERHEDPWASLRFRVGGKRIFYADPESGRWVGNDPPGQVSETELFPTERVELEMRKLASKMMERPSASVGKVEQTKGVMGNKPVVAGTRIPTATIWAYHEDGYDLEGILRAFPTLAREDVEAAIRFEQEKRRGVA